MENNPMTSPYSSTPMSNFPFSTNLLFSHDNNTNNSPIIPSFHQHDHHLLGLKREHNNNEAGSSSGVIKEEEKKEGKEKKVRRHRYAFHTRSQVDILDDGYRWRKYGQKAVKNNKFPRSYYRCTHPGCNVKKQVQRLTKDEEVVVTTYEGVHTHPVERSTDNFEHILKQMQIYVPP